MQQTPIRHISTNTNKFVCLLSRVHLVWFSIIYCTFFSFNRLSVYFLIFRVIHSQIRRYLIRYCFGSIILFQRIAIIIIRIISVILAHCSTPILYILFTHMLLFTGSILLYLLLSYLFFSYPPPFKYTPHTFHRLHMAQIQSHTIMRWRPLTSYNKRESSASSATTTTLLGPPTCNHPMQRGSNGALHLHVMPRAISPMMQVTSFLCCLPMLCFYCLVVAFDYVDVYLHHDKLPISHFFSIVDK